MKPTTNRVERVAEAFRQVGIEPVTVREDRIRLRIPRRSPEFFVFAVAGGTGRRGEVIEAIERGDRLDHAASFIVTARRFSPGAIEELERSKKNYLDDRHFKFRREDPWMLIERVQEENPEKLPGRQRLSGAAAAAAMTLLAEPDREWTVTELASLSLVSAGTAQNVVSLLEERGFVEREGRGPGTVRRVSDKEGLLGLLASELARDRRVLGKGFILAQGARDLTRKVGERLSQAGMSYAMTGACAALLMAPHATGTERCEVWVDATASLHDALAALNARQVEQGANIVLLQAKNRLPVLRTSEIDGIAVADPLRVYADLLQDPQRGEEQAEYLREQVIGF